MEDEPSIVALRERLGVGPTEDKPMVALETPHDPDRMPSFLNSPLADIEDLRRLVLEGADFLTPLQQRATEIRCYVGDPDGRLIELGNSPEAEERQ